MKKEIRLELKKIKKIANDKDVEVIEGKNHFKWKWKMNNKTGAEVSLQVTLGKSPSCWRWKLEHHRNLRRIFKDFDVEGYRIQ